MSARFCAWLTQVRLPFRVVTIKMKKEKNILQLKRIKEIVETAPRAQSGKNKNKLSTTTFHWNDYFYISTFGSSRAHSIGPSWAHVHRDNNTKNTIFLRRQSIVCYSLRYPILRSNSLAAPWCCFRFGPGSHTWIFDDNLCYSSSQPFSKVVRCGHGGVSLRKGQSSDSVCAPNTHFTVEKIMFSRSPKILSIFFSFSLPFRDNKRPQQQRMCTMFLPHLFIHSFFSISDCRIFVFPCIGATNK